MNSGTELIDLPEPSDVTRAHERIRDAVHRTPVLTCGALDEKSGARLFLKCENFQKTGAFKARGATNAVRSLSGRAATSGVVTHSSGNHGQALAYAAALAGIPAFIVMPDDTAPVKTKAVRHYGGDITFCTRDLSDREETMLRVAEETGAHLVHPYDDSAVIAGQGTAAMELLEDVPDLDCVVAPIGGGGLLSGTALAVQEARSEALVVGAEPAGAADAARSFAAGVWEPSRDPDTVCDGLLTSVGRRPWAILQERGTVIRTASDVMVLDAMRLVWERAKLVIEPSAAVALAVLLSGDVPGERVGLILSGGNADLDSLSAALARSNGS